MHGLGLDRVLGLSPLLSLLNITLITFLVNLIFSFFSFTGFKRNDNCLVIDELEGFAGVEVAFYINFLFSLNRSELGGVEGVGFIVTNEGISKYFLFV